MTSTSTSTAQPSIDRLYRARPGTVDMVDVPEMGFVVVDGVGGPGGPTFTDAVQALYTTSYGAHFAVRKATGSAPRVMMLEALWWVEGAGAQETIRRFAQGAASLDESDRAAWRWRAMIVQLPPIDEGTVERAVAAAKATKDLPALGLLRFERWCEGRCAQIMHVGPYATEQGSVVALHRAIADQGLRARGYHHEIYLGDPRRSAPDKLRTILRQPVEDGGA